MTSSEVGTASSTEMAELSTIDMALEVVTVPVSDVDRAKRGDIDAAGEDLISRGVDVSEVEEQPKPPGFPDLPGREWED